MIALVTGGREYRDKKAIYSFLDRIHEDRGIDYLVNGFCRGLDKIAHQWALDRGVQPVAMPALWDAEGTSAGTKRNKRMRDFANPDVCIAFPGSTGTANMMRLCFEKDIEIIDFEDY